ncbi:MAG TPA: MraY family glycosyltransferase [Thermoanaerobaculia bacterium]|nr:MraY family glycosyltransferase [Thermoanaerobaculia bacterium]
MREALILAGLSAAVAGLVTNLLVPVAARVAVAVRAVDHPGGRKLQGWPVPRLGGLAIVLGLALSAGALLLSRWAEWGAEIGRAELFALAVATAMIFLVGLVDDIVGVGTLHKFLVQLAAAALMVRIGWSFEVMRVPGLGEIELGAFGAAVSLFWIVGVTNAINLIDGLDGLAGGVVAIISGSLLTYSVLLGSPQSVVLMGATAGACLGFLRHNWAPARIFMGDSGSLTLGFLLAVMTVHSSLKAPAAVAILVPILALGVPVIDTLLVMGVRFLDRPKGALVEGFLRMFRADRKHLHHLLEHVRASRTGVVATIYGVVLVSCSAALLVAVRGDAALGLVLLAVEVMALLAIRRLGMAREAETLALQRRAEGGPAPGQALAIRAARSRRIAA